MLLAAFLAYLLSSIPALLAYLLGSIPFGLILTRLGGAGDLRQVGSGNIGATNVLRTGRRDLAAATLLLDGGKGAVAVLLARALAAPDITVLIVAGFAVVGHLFPVWLGFRGGKGVATTLGVLLAVAPVVGIIACLVWLLVAVASRYSSLAALVAIAVSPLTGFAIAGPGVALLALVLAVLVFIRHRENIERLLAGTESRINLRKSA
jgi:acyl phosphate:glycerol-3-phosphate acyltransferase